MQKTDYFPFGLAHLVANTNKNKYLYNSKELQDEVIGGTQLNQFDVEARFYDPVIGRTTTPDPHAENYYAWSPYHFVANNPVIVIDPTGRDTININGDGYVQQVLQAKGNHVINFNGTYYTFNDEETDSQQMNDILPESRYDHNYQSDPVRLFTPISNDQISKYMLDAGIISNSVKLQNGNIGYRYPLGFSLGVGAYDFVSDLYHDYGRANGAKPTGLLRTAYEDQTGGFYVLGNTTTMYNMHDAGNFLTGKAFQLTGYKEGEITYGAHIYQRGDSKADQNAVKSGYRYKLNNKK